MTEISDLDKTFYSDYDESNKDDNDIDKTDYSIRCEKCYSNAIIQKVDYFNNIFIVKCSYNHLYDYNSYKDFIDNTYMNLYNLLCNICNQNSNEMVKCEDCNIFICNECKAKHIHTKFINLDKIVNKNIINKTIINKNFNINIVELKNESQKVEDNIKIIKNIKKKYEKWLNDLTKYINKNINCILNYFLTQKKIINCIKNNINIFSLSNYKLFNKNNNVINNFLQTINNTINDEQIKEGIEKQSIIFLKVLNNIETSKNFSLINNINDEERQIVKTNDIIQNTNIINIQYKIGDMNKITLKYKSDNNNEIKSEIKCFSPFKNKQYFILGNKFGEINIFIFTLHENLLNEKYKLQLKLKVFNDEVKHLCEINENLFAVSDGKYEIKIIKYNNINNYSIIQNIYIDNYIYSMISLPLLSSKNNCHYLCFTDDNNIFIYKSNKDKNNLDEDILFFDIFKIIEINTITHSLIEINDKYLVASCTNIQTIKFFDMNNNFKEINELYNINSSKGTNIFTLMPNKNLLIVACTDGFKFISTIKMKKYKSVHCRYSVLCVELFNENSIICYCFDNKKYKIKQYKIKENSYELEKISEKIFQNNDEIWKLLKIEEKIFFIDGKNEFNFLSLIY